jgi:hypothetical protein
LNIEDNFGILGLGNFEIGCKFSTTTNSKISQSQNSKISPPLENILTQIFTEYSLEIVI